MSDASKGRTRLLVAGGSLLAVAGLVTAAAFTDVANLNLGTGGDGGIGGGDNRFNIQVVGTSADGTPVPGTWQEAATAEGVSIAVPGADLLTPGGEVAVDIPFRNESPALSADVAFSLQDRPGMTSSPGIASALRYTVELDGDAIVTAATQAQVAGLDLGLHAAGDDAVLSVTIALPDQGSAAANNAMQGQVSYVQAHFAATSVQP